MFRKHVELKIFSLIAGMVAVLVALTLVGLVAGGLHADRRELAFEEGLVAAGLAQRTNEIQTSLNPFLIWDEAVINIDNRFDPAWARQNVGVSITGNLHYPVVFLLNAQGEPLYGRIGQVDVPSASFARYGRAGAMLIAKVRAIERDPQQMAALHAVHASAVEYVDGAPVLLTASLFKPDLKAKMRGSTAPILVTGVPVSQSIVANFSRRYRLVDAHIQIDQNTLQRRIAKITIGSTSAGQKIVLAWSPRQPGSDLLRLALPLLGLAIVVVGAGAALLFRVTRRAAKRMMLSEAEAKHMALHDPLTGLANRALFTTELAKAAQALSRRAGHVGVFCIDLDRFKEINDSFGHAAGDLVIEEVARRLTALCRANDTVARLGGDEFAIILPDTTPQGAAALAARLNQGLYGKLDVAVGMAALGCSIGVSVIDDPKILQAEGLRQADVALYRAKQAGRNRYAFFEPEMDASLRQRKALERDLAAALEAGDITVAYQPLVDRKGTQVGVEALARWIHPERGPIAPNIFVPLAESSSLIGQLGACVFRQACVQSRLWPQWEVSVNVSALQLASSAFVAQTRAILEETGANAHAFTLEITETSLLKDDAATHQALRDLKALGFRLALDDFGTGYSSLAYLRHHPIDRIKIDRSFVAALPHDREAMALTKAVIDLAKSLGLQTTAEGVETEDQWAALIKLGCRQFQGYLFGKAVAPQQVVILPQRQIRRASYKFANESQQK
jgi:diguanylate cyclase (GGDEF)-like protein